MNLEPYTYTHLKSRLLNYLGRLNIKSTNPKEPKTTKDQGKSTSITGGCTRSLPMPQGTESYTYAHLKSRDIRTSSIEELYDTLNQEIFYLQALKISTHASRCRIIHLRTPLIKRFSTSSIKDLHPGLKVQNHTSKHTLNQEIFYLQH